VPWELKANGDCSCVGVLAGLGLMKGMPPALSRNEIGSGGEDGPPPP